ncbi:hypothetical protein KNE206_24560 [Kitasatospora sp. NE20-6]
MLGADVVVVEHPGFFLSQDDNPPRAVGEPFEHRFRSSERSASAGSVPALSFRMLVPLSGAAHGQPHSRGDIMLRDQPTPFPT